MKLTCPFCGKACEFEYWETEKVHLQYPMDEQGHVLYADGAMKQEQPGDLLIQYLQCTNCCACFAAKKELCDNERFDLKVSLGTVTQKGYLPNGPKEEKDNS